jgi:FixJ family two-component response regulator
MVQDILTGQADITLAIEALRAGADDFLMKPYDADELILRMERVLEKQEIMKKNRIYEKLIPICMYCKKSETTPAPNMEPENGYCWKNT